MKHRMRQHRTNDDDAFDARGLLKDGRRYRVPPKFMDSATGPMRVTDGNGGTAGLHRPGFRRLDDEAGNYAKARAYRQYETQLCDAYKQVRGDAAPNPHDDDDDGDEIVCPRCGGSGLDENGSDECPTCNGDGSVPADYEEEEEVADPQSDSEGLGRNRRNVDSRSIGQMVRDHQAAMAEIYEAYDYSLAQQWRRL
jgi:hypothetical protein